MQNTQEKKALNKYTVSYLIIAIIIVGLGYYFLNTKPNTKTLTNNQNIINEDKTMNQESNASELKIETLKEGTGEGAKNGDLVTVNYTGTLENGTKFDSSLNPGRSPFQFTLGQNMVIQGWELGILGMKVGEKRKLTIPAELGYGASGAGGVIPPNATLIFEVDLLKIN